jgi:DNA repair protein RecO
MKATYNLKGIILSRNAFKDRDSKIAVYSLEKGRVDFRVRGTSSLKSKLSGHIEPISFCSIMGVRGKQFDYAGAVVCEDAYANIKNNYSKIDLAGKVISFFLKEMKEPEEDQKIFDILKDFLDNLNLETNNNLDFDLFYYFFIFKLLDKLGYGPNFEVDTLKTKNNKYFDFKNSAIILEKTKNQYLKISDSVINILILVKKSNFKNLFSKEFKLIEKQELKKIISLFYKYNFC